MRPGIVLLLMLVVAAGPARAVESDKMAHLGVSHLITTSTYGLCKAAGIQDRTFSVIMAIGLASMVAVSKEFSDRRFDGGDLIYDGIGIGTSTLFIYTFEF
jgi:hypothetical protein